MDTVINRLSEIDEAANSIMEETNVRKKAFAQEIEKKTAAFDLQLEKETAERISQIRSQMEKEMQEMLDKHAASGVTRVGLKVTGRGIVREQGCTRKQAGHETPVTVR